LSSIQLSDELRTFLSGRLTSADQIDIIVLLLENRDRAWAAPDVAQALQMAPESTAMRLFLLASGGLIAFEPSAVPRYRYAPADETTDRLIHEVTTAYTENRADVLRAIGVSVPAPDPIQSFAEAFKLKR
jgi:hypothetical protein